MAGASTNKTLLLDAYCSKTINDTEFLFLYDINSCSNLHLPCWKYDHFSLEDVNDDECKAEIRFLREDIYTLRDIINIPKMFTCYNGVKVTGIKGLFILLKSYSYPNTYLDLMPRFGRPVLQLCGLRLALGNQKFPVRVRLLAMCRGELSAVIARLMSKCL